MLYGSQTGLPGSRKRLLHFSQSNWNCSLNWDVKPHAHFDLLLREKWNVAPELVLNWGKESSCVLLVLGWLFLTLSWLWCWKVSQSCGLWAGCRIMNVARMRRTHRATSWPCPAQGSPWWSLSLPYSQGHFLLCDYSLWFSFVVPTHALLFGLNPLNNPSTPCYSTWKARKSNPSVISYVDWIWAAAHCNQENANYLPNCL